MKTFDQKIKWLSPGKWELSWYQDQLTPGKKEPEPIRHKRKTGLKGAKLFCKKHGLEFLKDTHSGRKIETASERRRRYYLHAKLRKQGFTVDAYKHLVVVNKQVAGNTVGIKDIKELSEKGYMAQMSLDSIGGFICSVIKDDIEKMPEFQTQAK